MNYYKASAIMAIIAALCFLVTILRMSAKWCGVILVTVLLAAPASASRYETIVTVDQEGRPTSETWIREDDRRMEDFKAFEPPPAPEPALNDPPPSRERPDVRPQP